MNTANLITFANDTLEILADDQWSADTLDYIARRAYELGLAESDIEGFFTIAE